MYEYDLVIQKHRGVLGGRFDGEDLEALLNERATDGWEFDRILDPETTAILEDGKAVHLILFRRPRS
jgi:hypothetical protein